MVGSIASKDPWLLKMDDLMIRSIASNSLWLFKIDKLKRFLQSIDSTKSPAVFAAILQLIIYTKLQIVL